MSMMLAVFGALGCALSQSTHASPAPNPLWEVALERGGDVWMARADGSGLKRLIKNAKDPHWSRNGKKVAFSRSGDVWVLNLTTHTQRRVTRFTEKDRAPVTERLR